MILVAHHGDRQNARPGRADALQQPAQKHHGKIDRHNGDQTTEKKDGETRIDGGFASDTVGNRPVDHLRRSKPEEQNGNYRLAVVFAPRAELA